MDILAGVLGDFFSDNSLSARFLQAGVVLGFALLLLFLFDRLVELITPKVAKRADTIITSENVLQLRRAETFIGVGITLVRTLVIITALFTIWQLSNPSTGPIALIGVGTVAIVLASATVVPLLRDITYGFIMIAERWYSVGDHIVVEPFAGTGGVVERLSLRSTKLRSINGEVIWVHHQYVQGVRVTSAASHPVAVETFVNDPERGRKIIEDAIKIIPSTPTTIPQPLTISEVKKIDDNLWRITAVCAVAPFREWIIDDFAVEVIQKTDKLSGKEPAIVHGPIVFYEDATAEKRYQRSGAVRKRVRASLTE